MIWTTLASLSNDRVATTYNTVYTDYFVPFDVDDRWVEQIIERQAVDLSASPLWLDDDGQLIGMAVLAIREQRGWVGGFGIAPAYRKRGLSHQLAAELIAVARSRGLQQITLEVISQNAPAIRTYERAGFGYSRNLLVLSRTDQSTTASACGGGIETSMDAALLAARRKMLPIAAWQRSATAIAGVEGLRALVLGSPCEPTALALFTRTGDSVNLVDIAAKHENAADNLVNELIALAPQQRLIVVNEPEDSPLVPALLALGWTEIMRQHEMSVSF